MELKNRLMKKLLFIIFVLGILSCGRTSPQKGYHNCEIHMKDSTIMYGWNVSFSGNYTSFVDTSNREIDLKHSDIAYVIYFINPRKN